MSVSAIDGRAADALILRIAQRDMLALESLYNAMYREIYGYLFSMLGGDRSGAEDLAQDTFVRVWKYAPKFSPMGQGRAWVYRIAGRLALNALGNRSPCTEELTDSIPDSSDVEERALDAQAAAQALAALTPDEREIVTLHAVAGLSLREIAEMTGRPLGTIKWKHAEAIKKLRSLLGEGFGREGTE